MVDFVEAFARVKLGREIVRTHDTPAFAGNRVGLKVLNEAAQLAEQIGPLLVDRIVGPYTGRALTPLATIDLVGWDIHRAIVDNVYANTDDEAHETLELPGYMDKLMEKGVLGDKTGDMPARMWSIDEPVFRRLPTNGFVYLEGETQPYQGELQLIIQLIEPAEPTREEIQDLLPVTSRDIADGCKVNGLTVDRSQVLLEQPIKTTGITQVRVELHPEVVIPIGVNVARSQEEADKQERGEDLRAAEQSEAESLEAELAAELAELGSAVER